MKSCCAAIQGRKFADTRRISLGRLTMPRAPHHTALQLRKPPSQRQQRLLADALSAMRTLQQLCECKRRWRGRPPLIPNLLRASKVLSATANFGLARMLARGSSHAFARSFACMQAIPLHSPSQSV